MRKVLPSTSNQKEAGMATLLAIRETQITTMMRYHHVAI